MQRARSRSGERIHLRSQRKNRIPIRSKLNSGFELFQLPDDFVVVILDTWLDSEYLLPLDDAMCSKEQRDKYLRALSRLEYAVMGWTSAPNVCADLVLRLCKLRQISLTKLHTSRLFMRRGNFPWSQYQLCMKNLTHLQSVVDTTLLDTWVCELLPSAPSLQDLHIVVKGIRPVSSKLFRTIARHCRALTELRLFNLTGSLSPPLGLVIRNCTRLSSLEAFHCLVSDADATHLSPTLTHLSITNRESENTLTAAFVRQVACRCPLLESLSIEQGWGAETLYTPYILRIVGKKLEYLHSFTAEVTRWSLPMFSALTASCSHLREVSLCGCHSMPVDVVHSVLFTMPHLHSLTLSGHTAYNGPICGSVLRGYSSIQFLSLIEFTALTNKGMVNLLCHCPNLHALNFSSMSLINLNIVDSLVLHCKKMERVYFTRCPTRPYTLTKKKNTLNFSFSVEINDPKIQ